MWMVTNQRDYKPRKSEQLHVTQLKSYEDENVDFVHVQPHYCRVRQAEPFHRLGEAPRHSS